MALQRNDDWDGTKLRAGMTVGNSTKNPRGCGFNPTKL